MQTIRLADALSLQLVQLTVPFSSAQSLTAESPYVSCFDTLDKSSDRVRPIPGASGSSPRFAYHLHHHSINSSCQPSCHFIAGRFQHLACLELVLTRPPDHSSSLQCTLSSSLKWSSKSSSATTEASSTFALSSAAFDSRRMLAASR